MCLSPITIKNPNFKQQHYPLFSDNISSKLQVPCGHCKECVSLKQTYLIQRVQMLAKEHHIFMLTLTYNRKHLPEVDINGYRHLYVDFRHWQNMIKRMRKYNVLGHPFKYLVVSEYGGTKHRPHFHALIFIKRSLITRPFEWAIQHFFDFYQNWSVNVGTSRKPKYELCSTWKHSSDGRRTYDFHWVNPYLIKDGKIYDESSVAFYVSKYIMKFDPWIERKRKALRMSLSDEEYNYYWRLLRPHCHFSHDFFPSTTPTAKTLSHLPERLEPFLQIMKDTAHLAPFFKNFVFSYKGKTFPLAKYLRKFLVPLKKSDSFTLGQFYSDNKHYKELIDYYGIGHWKVDNDVLGRAGLTCADLSCWNAFVDRYNQAYQEMIDALCKAKANWTGCLGYIESRSDAELESARRAATRFYSRSHPANNDYSDDLPDQCDFVIDEDEYEYYEYCRLHPNIPYSDYRQSYIQLELFDNIFEKN